MPLRVMLVTDRRRLVPGPGAVVALAREAARAGVDDLQIREKDLCGRDLTILARQIANAVYGTSARLFVNGRPDVAEAVGAAGVQLPEDGLPVADVKRAFPRLTVGASRHSIESVRRAAADGADFVLLGPVFATPGKEDRALGVEVVAAAARAVTIPVYAIGGIDAETAPRVAEAGAAGIALLRPFLEGRAADTLARIRRGRS